MSWERDPLFSKAKLYFEKAFEEDKEGSFFGLFCALGLELLARSAIASVSPTLLAEPDKEQKNLLYALNIGSTKPQPKSITVHQVLNLCQFLITEFTEADNILAKAIVSRRNEEIHSGTAAFDEYHTQQWIAGFYKCCKLLTEFQGESLNSLFGVEIQTEAELILEEIEDVVIGKTKELIVAHKRVFENKEGELKNKIKEEATKKGLELASRGYHRVTCPACGCIATVFGEPFGNHRIEHADDEIIVRQSILPTKFNCTACELKLTGYGSLKAVNLANHYTRTHWYTPEEYYNLINPDDEDSITQRYNEINPPEDYWGWNNE